jgi:1,4-dihydroxy-2-naphthoate octaprenyltransferase
MTGYFHLWVFLAVLPITFLAFLNLLAVTWPDRIADYTIGKRTLATKLSPKILRILFFSVLITSFIIHVLIWNQIIPNIVFLAGLPAYFLILYGGFKYTKKETSIEVVIGLHLMIISQSFAWILTRFGIY